MKNQSKRFSLTALGLLLGASLFLAGCGKHEVDKMKAGLVRTGLSAEEADCFAHKMSETVDRDPYNYMAELMNAGLDEKTAVNKARRKYGAEFKDPMEKAREACVK